MNCPLVVTTGMKTNISPSNGNVWRTGYDIGIRYVNGAFRNKELPQFNITSITILKFLKF
jgi:hypothetical protein